MKYQEKWIMEVINWWCPWGSYPKETPIGSTSDQTRKETSSSVCVWEYVSPRELLRFIDPFFKPRDEETFDFFDEAASEGRPFAPPQVWISVNELGSFPENHWSSAQAAALKRVERGARLSNEEKAALVRPHEGRHRLWFAAHYANETLVPVQVWLEKTPREIQSLKRDLKESQEDLQREQSDNEYLYDKLLEYRNRYGDID